MENILTGETSSPQGSTHPAERKVQYADPAYKEKWFDMIASGEKTKEYREIKPYYRKRLETIGLLDVYGLPVVSKTRVMFRHGYSTKSPQIEAEVTPDIKEGRPEWGAEPGAEYYVFKILRIWGFEGD